MKIALLSLLLSFSAYALDYANEDKLSLIAGWGLQTTSVFIHDQRLQQTFGTTLRTAAAYREKQSEFGLCSFIMVGLTDERKNTLLVQGSEVRGSYWYRALSLGPFYRHYFPWKENWEWYPTAAFLFEMVGLHPVDPEDIEVRGGNFNKKNRLRYQGRGGMLGVGFLRHTEKKMGHYFVELNYKVIRLRSVTIMKDTSWKDTVVDEKQPVFSQTTEHSLLLSVGMTLL